MTRDAEIPKWAVERAEELAAAEAEGGTTWTPLADAFARYIAAHEEPPVDPLLVEARQIAAEIRRSAREGAPYQQCSIAAKIEAGEWDDHQLVLSAERALRRGMELAKEQSA